MEVTAMKSSLARRQFLRAGLGLGASALASAWPFPQTEEVVPFLDVKPPAPGRIILPWEQTTSWITPKEHFFAVAHYGMADVDLAAWRLDVRGLVASPQAFTLEALRRRPRREMTVTLECSGNPADGGLVGNARWAGTPLAPVLKDCGLRSEGLEIVFFGADQGTEKIRGDEYRQHFARALTVADALRDNVLLVYEMNGEPLSKEHGAPLRLMAPGWYGVNWVKWLSRIEVHDRPYLNRFMGRDYVTIRGEKQGNEVVWRETSVGKMNLKSVVGRITREAGGSMHVTGAAWGDGTPLRGVELKIDNGPWTPVQIGEGRDHPYTWKFWSYEWRSAQPGEHTLQSRATDATGRVQPAPDDPFITMKKTYWEANQQAARKIKL
jgi:DMSO/TMAO reductase YedYZ molybdopterin-dependent catalytic subunit